MMLFTVLQIGLLCETMDHATAGQWVWRPCNTQWTDDRALVDKVGRNRDEKI